MKAGLIGLPLSGKSTVFWAVTGQKADPGEMPQERLATVQVPDERLTVLGKMVKPKKYTPATMEFVDFPGASLEDSHGQQDFKKYIPGIKKCDLLVLVVRAHDNSAVPAHRNRVDPAADLAELREELIFADLLTVSTRLERIEKALAKPKKADDEKREQAVLLACQEALENSRPVSSVINNQDEARLIASFAFLTEKPAIVVYNVGEEEMSKTFETPEHVHSAITLCADAEAQIADLEEDDRAAFMEDLGITEPARDRLIRNAYQAVGLISFLTMGPAEVRAWPVPKDSTAVEAAAKIHSDIARGFIRAETVAYDDLVAAGDEKSAKAAGKVRQEGKSYVVQDGDVILFKFNV